jgi:transposase
VGTWRRQRAWELHQAGWWQKDIAVALGVSPGAVSQWIKRGRDGGVGALRTRPRPGGPARLTSEQREQIPGLLTRGAPAYGFGGDVWTAKRIAEVIRRTFGVRYHPDHVSRLLRRAGWSRQQPIERATQRDEEAIQHWYEERWPARRTKRSRKGPPSSGETNRASPCCRTRCGPGRHAGRRRCCA